MATGYRLLDQPNPNYPQYGYPRRNGRKVTGGIILHSAEGGTDLSGADTAAENVARYLGTRTTPGSYHVLVDRDSILRMVPFDYEAWHDTTSNNYTVGISVAWNKADLPRMTRAQRDAYYRQLARAVLSAVAWFKARGIHVPTDRFLSRDEIVAGKPGLSTHSRMDPGRRSDPFGTGSVYEAEFLAVLAAMATPATTATAPTTPATPTQSRKDVEEVPKAIQFSSKGADGSVHVYVAFPNAREYDYAESQGELRDYENILSRQGYDYEVWKNSAGSSLVTNPDVFGRYVGPPAARPAGAKREA